MNFNNSNFFRFDNNSRDVFIEDENEKNFLYVENNIHDNKYIECHGYHLYHNSTKNYDNYHFLTDEEKNYCIYISSWGKIRNIDYVHNLKHAPKNVAEQIIEHEGEKSQFLKNIERLGA